MTELDDFDLWPQAPPARGKVPSPCVSVHGAYHALERRLRAATREHGLSGSEALTLAFLLREPGCAAVVVRHALGFHRSTLSSLLDRLESKDMISRAPNSYDGRRLEIELTATGRIAAGIAETVIRDVDDELATYTSPSERRGAEAVFAACTAINGSRNGLDF